MYAAAAVPAGSVHPVEPDAGTPSLEAPAESEPDAEPSADVMPDAKRALDPVQQLISAGFSPDRAQTLVRRQADLRRAAVERELASTGTVHPLDASSSSAIEQQLRSELGDDDYEKYLTARGQATRIRVGDVEVDSAAENAGIQSGDEILMYAGRRVFTPRDLNALMLRTPEGQTVPTTIVRNGQTMQLYVTGGALGISHQTRR